MFVHQLALRLGLVACLSAGVVIRPSVSLANPNPVQGVQSSILPAELPKGKQNTRPVPPTPSQPEPATTYTRQELQQIVLVLREIQRQRLRPQQTQQIDSLIRELEQLIAQGQPQVVLSPQQGRQLQAILTSLSREEIDKIQESLDLPEVEVGIFSQGQIRNVLSILRGIQQLGLRPRQTREIQALIRDLEQLQAQGEPQVILSPEQTEQLRNVLDSLTPDELARIEEEVGVQLETGNRLSQAELQQLLSFLRSLQRLRPQQSGEIGALIRQLEQLQAQGEAVVVLSPQQTAQVQALIASLSSEELTQLQETLPQQATPRKFTQQEVSELLAILEAARETDLSPQQAREVEELIDLLQSLQDRGEAEVILSAQQVQTLLSLINSFTQDQLQVITRAIGGFGSFPAISINNPTGFGAGWGDASIGILINQQNRFTSSSDGSLSASLGLGDPEESIGLTVTLAITGLSNERGQDDNLGAGSIALQASRILPNNFAVSAGVINLVDWAGAADDTGRSFYAVVSKALVFNENVQEPFSLGFVTLGVGNGVFRLEDNFDPTDELGGPEFNVFGTFAVTMGSQATAIAEWTGQDLTVGLSVVPFKRIPLVTTFGLNDLTGTAGDRVRLNFSIIYGLSF